MADYFIQFSCIFDVGSAENTARANAIRSNLAAELDRDEGSDVGFEIMVDHEHGPGALWVNSGEYGEPEHVIRFVLRCAAAFNLSGVWGFTWALSCSKPRLDAFGGGAHVIDLSKCQSIADIDCHSFVGDRMTRSSPAIEAEASP